MKPRVPKVGDVLTEHDVLTPVPPRHHASIDRRVRAAELTPASQGHSMVAEQRIGENRLEALPNHPRPARKRARTPARRMSIRRG